MNKCDWKTYSVCVYMSVSASLTEGSSSLRHLYRFFEELFKEMVL